MPAPKILKQASTLGLRAAATLSFLAPLLSRIALGNAFYLTGRGKLEHFDNFVRFLTELGIPFPALNAAVVARIEYYGAILLVVGLLTRIAAAGLLSTMAVALLTADRQSLLNSWNPDTEAGPLDIAAFVNFLLLAWLTLFGPGWLSLDALVSRWLGVGNAAKEAQTPQP
jgi:uncharacterized membrane protein YphA (DoxX/SURF4 family)